jgi:hypothetical protein
MLIHALDRVDCHHASVVDVEDAADQGPDQGVYNSESDLSTVGRAEERPKDAVVDEE